MSSISGAVVVEQDAGRVPNIGVEVGEDTDTGV